jgi:hypothetical protein
MGQWSADGYQLTISIVLEDNVSAQMDDLKAGAKRQSTVRFN